MTKHVKITRAACFLLVGLSLLGFSVAIVRNAWLSDDAYITFRTVDNFINGYGLTWNVSERVQTYTHPLWMFLLSGLYYITQDLFFTSQLLSVSISLCTVFILITQVSRSTAATLLGLILLTFSKAYVDYATSGLENPLTHLLLSSFCAIYLTQASSSKKLFRLSLLAALGMVNRMDTALLFFPALLYALLNLRELKGLYISTLGFAPFIAWELFSLFYYGFPFPNTAFAKLNAGLISRATLVEHGLYYWLDALKVDPLTPLAIALSMSLPWLTQNWRIIPLTLGVALYSAYIVWIGGDFMSGRFLTAPLLVSTIVLVKETPRLPQAFTLAFIALFIIVGTRAPTPPLWSPPDSTVPDPGSWLASHGISDERANYWRNTNILRAQQNANLPDHDWAIDGRKARQAGPDVIVKGSVGFFGYFAGPHIHVVDLLGLGDPLLSRLPPTDYHWRIGHFGRIVPDGYLATLETGQNQIEDQNLALYYDKLSLVTRGPLFSFKRIKEVWKFNLQVYDPYLDAYAYFRGAEFSQALHITNPTNKPYVYTYVWNNGAAETYLLDDHSRQGNVYQVNWHISADGSRLAGPYHNHVASGHALTDTETLNVGVFFRDTPDSAPFIMYERRFWFKITSDENLTIVLPGAEWYNAEAPHGLWYSKDIDSVLNIVP